MQISNNQHALILLYQGHRRLYMRTQHCMEKVLTSMDTSHMYVRMLACTYATAHIVCYGHFATLLMAMESHAYSIMFPSNGNFLPGKLRNRKF